MKIFAYLSLLSVFLIVGFSACEADRKNPKAPQTKRMELDTLSQYSDQNYRIYTLEGCEYIVYGYGNSRWGSHKGNCKNHQVDSVEVLKQEIKDLNSYIKQLEQDNQIMGSELGNKFYNEKK
jgi:hypothetical protein